MQVKLSVLAAGAIALLPLSAKAECLRGPNVVVNRGHGASITFDEPVYEAKIFDISQVILSEIPEQGSRTLILTAIDRQDYPGLPATPQTSLVASTADSCYVFQLSFADGSVHTSVDAVRDEPSDRLLVSAAENAAIDVPALRAALEQAVERFGDDNQFLERANSFISLVEGGVEQREAAQRVNLPWAHLETFARQAHRSIILDESISQ